METRGEKTFCVQAGETEAGTPTWRQRKTNKQAGMLVHRSCEWEAAKAAIGRVGGGGGEGVLSDAAEGLRWRPQETQAFNDSDIKLLNVVQGLPF